MAEWGECWHGRVVVDGTSPKMVSCRPSLEGSERKSGQGARRLSGGNVIQALRTATQETWRKPEQQEGRCGMLQMVGREQAMRREKLQEPSCTAWASVACVACIMTTLSPPTSAIQNIPTSRQKMNYVRGRGEGSKITGVSRRTVMAWYHQRAISRGSEACSDMVFWTELQQDFLIW